MMPPSMYLPPAFSMMYGHVVRDRRRNRIAICER